jgi:hypothetical protein
VGIDLLFSTIGRSLFKGRFSKTLDKMGKRLIGRYYVNSLGGFHGFKMRMSCATFHCAGKYHLSKIAMYNWVRYFIPIQAIL